MREALIERLIGVLRDGPPVRFAFLFGSTARGTAGPDSDVDIAFVPVDPAISLADELALAARLERAAGRPVDLVRLDMATNALLLDDRKLDWLARHQFLVVLSWDGAPKTHNLERVAGGAGLDTYSVMRRVVDKVLRSGVDCSVIPVATPGSVKNLAANIEHLLSLGIRSFDLNYAIGVEWPRRARGQARRGADPDLASGSPPVRRTSATRLSWFRRVCAKRAPRDELPTLQPPRLAACRVAHAGRGTQISA